MLEPASFAWSIFCILTPYIPEQLTGNVQKVNNHLAECKHQPKSSFPLPAHVYLPTLTKGLGFYPTYTLMS